MVHNVLSLLSSAEVVDFYHAHAAGDDDNQLSLVVILCLTQQLAADLCHNNRYRSAPGASSAADDSSVDADVVASVRGLTDWLKSLVMLLTSSDNDAANDTSAAGAAAMSLRVLPTVLRDLQSVHKMITVRSSKSPRQSASPMVEVSGACIVVPSSASSVKFDIQMLICLLQQYMQENA